MKLILSSVAGFAVGWTLRVLFADAAQKYVEKRLTRAFRVIRRQIFGRGERLDETTLRLGPEGERVYVHTFEREGLPQDRFDCRLVDGRTFRELFEDRPEGCATWSFEQLLHDIEATRKDLRQRFHEKGVEMKFDSTRLAPTRVWRTREGVNELPVVGFDFSPSDEATYRVLAENYSVGGGIDLLQGWDLDEIQPFLSHSFGLNATVTTSSGDVLIAQRSVRTRKHGGRMHIAVNEAMREDDTNVRGDPDPWRTLSRGMYEELGIDLGQHDGDRAEITLHSVITDLETYGWAVLAHVDLTRTGWSTKRVLAARATKRASDAWEIASLSAVQWTVPSLLRFVRANPDWVPWGLLNVVLSADVDGLRGARKLDALLGFDRVRLESSGRDVTECVVVDQYAQPLRVPHLELGRR